MKRMLSCNLDKNVLTMPGRRPGSGAYGAAKGGHAGRAPLPCPTRRDIARPHAAGHVAPIGQRRRRRRKGRAQPARGGLPPPYGRRPYSSLTKPGGHGGIFQGNWEVNAELSRKFSFQVVLQFSFVQLNIPKMKRMLSCNLEANVLTQVGQPP